MLRGYFKGFVYALAYRHRRHNDNKFCKAVSAVQLKYRFGINIGFARTRFHLNTKLHIGSVLCHRQFVSFLNIVHIFGDCFFVYVQCVPDSKVVHQR